jgi:O-antigen/teichoic acid export membrane protein
VRFWLSESERRPDPAPARADARKAMFVGTHVWLVALIVAIVLRPQLMDAGLGWFVWAAAIGVAIGVVGLAVVLVIRRRIVRQERGSAD